MLVAAVQLALILVSGCSDDKPENTTQARQVLAYVNGDAIYLDEFRNYYRAQTVNQDDPPTDTLSILNNKVKALGRLADRVLILQETRRMGIQLTPQELKKAEETIRADYPKDTFDKMLTERRVEMNVWKGKLAENLLIEKILRDVISPTISISDLEIQSYYDNNLNQFQQELTVSASQIVVATENQAQQVMQRLKEGADFAILAQEVSIAPERNRGGDLGTFGKGQMPTEFDKIIFTLKKGETSKVEKTQYGYHIFRVIDRKEKKTITVSEAREQIETLLKEKKLDEQYNQWLIGLREKAEISINESLLGR